MKQYEIWWAHLPPPIGRRPVLLLTRTPAYGYLNKVLVAEVTSTVRNIPQEIALGAADGISANSVANLDNIHAVPKRLLVSRIGALARSRQQDAKRALGYVLDSPELKIL